MTWAKRMMLVDAISESGVGIRTSAEDIILPLAEVAKLSDIKRLDYAEKLLRRNGLLGFGDVLTEAQKKQILSAHYTELAEGGVARIRPKVEILESFTIEQRRVLMDRGVTGSNVKSSLIDESKLFYNVRRIDSSTTRSAYGSNKVTESNLYDLFSYEYRGLKEAKAITYLDEVGDYHIRFWSMGEGNTGNSIHHRDALSDLIDQEAESLIKQALNTEDEILLELGLQRKEIAKSISLNRVQSSFPEDILKRSQGALLILDRTGKIRYFYIDSSILSTQISRGQTISAKKLSETIRFLHESIDPELRAYNFVHIKGLGSMKLDGELSLPDNLQAIELVL